MKPKELLELLERVAVFLDVNYEVQGAYVKDKCLSVQVKDKAEFLFTCNYDKRVEYQGENDPRRYFTVKINLDDGFIKGISGVLSIYSFKSFNEIELKNHHISNYKKLVEGVL